MTEDEVLSIINRRIQEAGSQKAFAREIGISEQYLSDIVNRRRSPGESVLSALGIKRTTVYEPESEE